MDIHKCMAFGLTFKVTGKESEMWIKYSPRTPIWSPDMAQPLLTSNISRLTIFEMLLNE